MQDDSPVQHPPELAPEHARQRTFRVGAGERSGTAFALHHDGHPFLVTANHVLVDAQQPSDILVVGSGGKIDVGLTEVVRAPLGNDVAIFAISEDPFPNVEWLTPAVRPIAWSQQAFFLGHPDVDGLLVNRPLVKRATFSGAFDYDDGDRLWLLDGMSNPGFSGGPVLCYDTVDGLWRVGAVLSGYDRQPVTVIVQTEDYKTLKAIVGSNPGLFRAWDIGPALGEADKRRNEQRAA